MCARLVGNHAAADEVSEDDPVAANVIEGFRMQEFMDFSRKETDWTGWFCE
jgi:hypothetical protein